MIGTTAGFVLLATLTATVGLDGLGWTVGAAVALGTGALLDRAQRVRGTVRLGPADRVTLTRAVLVAGVTALVVSGFRSASPTALLVALSAVGLGLDAVDGWVARRTCTASPLGARFDMEVDAFLILVLSVEVGRTAGWWVLTIGAARYLLLVAQTMRPWLQAPVPARYWCKVVAAIQGITLTVAIAWPSTVTTAMVVVALGLLVESFGREVWWRWLWRAGDRRAAATHPRPARLAHV